MLSFCTTPHGLLEEESFAGAERRRQRRTSLPAAGTRLAGVKRVASLGGKRSVSNPVSRRGANSNLKALISQPRDFVHLSHGGNSSTIVCVCRFGL